MEVYLMSSREMRRINRQLTSAVMKTIATVLPLAALCAAVVSVSLRLEVTVDPIAEALVLMALSGSMR